MRKTFFIFLLFLFFSVPSFATNYDCGTGSSLVFSPQSNSAGKAYTLDGVDLYQTVFTVVVVPCVGVHSISPYNAANHVWVMAYPSSSAAADVSWSQLMSFSAGTFCAVAFAVAASRKW